MPTEDKLIDALIATNERQHMLINQLLMLHNVTLTTIMAEKQPERPDPSQSAEQKARHSAQVWALQADLERAQVEIEDLKAKLIESRACICSLKHDLSQASEECAALRAKNANRLDHDAVFGQILNKRMKIHLRHPVLSSPEPITGILHGFEVKEGQSLVDVSQIELIVDLHQAVVRET